MKFLVVTNAPTLKEGDSYKAYAPYVKEMDLWSTYVDDFRTVSPSKYNHTLLKSSFKNQPTLIAIPSIKFTGFFSALISILYIPLIGFKLFKAMLWADHIHLRCPGNIGLLGCVVQMFFPSKPKTAKYAGNWDPKAKQPLSYRFQKWILSNTFLTKNMQVLVYGDWENQTKNIKPFFTASYSNIDRVEHKPRNYDISLSFVFIGSLVSGKRPFLAIKIIEALSKKGHLVTLDVFGDGVLRQELEAYCNANNLNSIVTIHGNQSSLTIQEFLKTAHFSILASKSEGWPKAIAEAMFYGVIPIATNISCVPYMLDYGNRGILIDDNLESAISHIETFITNQKDLEILAEKALLWSQCYTLDFFEKEIVKLLS